jgi:membrane associated rhomboid family serine protease/Zn-finger nucleic acid-binding protein
MIVVDRVRPMTTSAHPHELSAQCPACGLHELVAVQLERDRHGHWRRADDEGWLAGLVRRRRGKEPEAAVVSVQIDTCPMCFGAWFDSGELDVLAGQLGDVESILDGQSRETRRPCPRGHGQMLEHDLPAMIRTPVDRCAQCGGIWLDGEERRKLAKATTARGQGTLTERALKRGAIWAMQVLRPLPVEVENPARGTPWVVYGLLLLLLALFLGQELEQIDTYHYALVPGRTRHQGDWAGMFTYMFLHGGWWHLLGNAYFLYTFGDNIEDLFGRVRFAVFFAVAGVLAGLIHYWFATNTATPVVGASGAISGVLAAYLWAFPRQRLFQTVLFVQLEIPMWVYLFVWVGYHIVMALFATGAAEEVAWFAHLGGFLVGIAVTPLLLRVRRREVARRVRVPAFPT